MIHLPNNALQWRAILHERVNEATCVLGSLSGVRGLVLGGSVGRGEAWPLSDIDMLPIVHAEGAVTSEIEQQRSGLVDWWAASGRAQTLDVGWLRFTDAEVMHATSLDSAATAALVSEPRWLHGMDKAYGGRGVSDADGLAQAFAEWATAMRFEPPVIAARVEQWARQVHDARADIGRALDGSDAVMATLGVRTAARALRLVLVEGWGERLGSMGREWTKFERMAQRHGAEELAEQLALLADAHPAGALERAAEAPAWLQERIALAYAGRQLIGEQVGREENARDQLAAFAVHVARRTAQPWAAWMRLPATDLHRRVSILDQLMATLLPAK